MILRQSTFARALNSILHLAIPHHTSRTSPPASLSDREKYFLWAASQNDNTIHIYTGLDHVPGDAIIVVGQYSSEKLRSRRSMIEDFHALEALEFRGFIRRISKTRLKLTPQGLRHATGSRL